MTTFSKPADVSDPAQPVFQKASVSLALAQRMIERAVERANELGLRIAVVVLDESGVLKAFARMDGAPLVAVEVARRKALTAVGFGLATGQPWVDFSRGDLIMEQGIKSLPDFTLLAGGHPLRLDEQVTGAIGVSGGHYTHDDECAKAALALLTHPR